MWHSYVTGDKLSVKPSKKHKQDDAYSEELTYAPTWPSRWVLWSHTCTTEPWWSEGKRGKTQMTEGTVITEQ